MPEVINSSFIPKKDLGGGSQKKRKGGGIDIFLLIALIIFLSSIVLSLGVFLWSQSVQNKNEELFIQIESYRDNFAISSIIELISVSNKVEAAKEILDNHYSVLPAFSYLEENTLSDIYLNDMVVSEKGNKIEVSATGIAPDFDYVAYASKVYARDDRIDDLILENFSRNNLNEVVFNLSFSMDKSFLYNLSNN